MGSLAGAAHLLHKNAGVLSGAQCEQKSHMAHQGKSSVDFATLSTSPNRESVALRSFGPVYVQGTEARGDGKVTTGITGLWRPSVHSDVAF